MSVTFSRANIVEAFGRKCAYCGFEFVDFENMSFDHVVPKPLGGTTDWTNIVLACFPCNAKKGVRTPEEAGMVLIQTPKKENL